MTDHLTSRREIPDATVARLPEYLRALTALAECATTSVSSKELAGATGVSSAKLRKDLSYLGSYGVRGVGYSVAHLCDEIARELGLTQDWPVVIVGMGNLGRALADYRGFLKGGFRVVALLDHDPAVVAERVGDLAIEHADHLSQIVGERHATIGVIATPASSAQQVCEVMVAAGIRSILNFAPCLITVPPGVDIRSVDLATELQILAFHRQRRALAPPASASPSPVRPAAALEVAR